MQYIRRTDATSVRNVGTQLHTSLIAAGWTLEFADADAIGTGTATNPAWDKVPAINTDMGRVIYRMSATPRTTPWFVEFRQRLGAAVGLREAKFRTAKGQAGGVLTDPGTSVEWNSNGNDNASTATTPWFFNASASGFSFVSAGVQGSVWGVELWRDAAGALTDDIAILGSGSNFAAASVIGFGTMTTQQHGAVKVRSVDAEYSGRPWLSLAQPTTSAAAYANIASMKVDGGLSGAPLGPFLFGRVLGGLPRHFFLAHPADVTVDLSQAVTVDGGNKNYYASGITGGPHQGHGHIMVAQQ